MKEKTIQFAREASKYDPDGIDVITFGHQIKVLANITADKAADAIGALRADEGATMTHELIRKAWDLHKAGKYEQTVLFIATDGDPSDRDAVKQAIIDITQKVDDEREFNISFLTVGTPDAKLQAFLTALDDVRRRVERLKSYRTK